MTSSDDTPATNPAPDETRLSSLSKALLRISSSLDLETVLREVVGGARVLTDARYGCIVAVDETGTADAFVTSGLTDNEHRRVEQWPDGPKLFEQLRHLPGPFRIADFGAFARSFGATWDAVPSRACMSTPLRHFGVQVGNFFLETRGRGRVHRRGRGSWCSSPSRPRPRSPMRGPTERASQRARADLAAPGPRTSPLRPPCCRARLGRLVSINREARRMFEALRTPGRPVEHLLEEVTGRFSDGREIALDRFPLTQELSRAETMRAEELVLSNPDGRSISTLVNATPIHAEDGAVESVVVTLQDLAPLEALDRMRADFLGMVSHELRTPLAAIKGSTATVLNTPQSFGPAETRQLFRIIDQRPDRMSGLSGTCSMQEGRLPASTRSGPSHGGGGAGRGGETASFRRQPALGAHRLPGTFPAAMARPVRSCRVLETTAANPPVTAPEVSDPHRAERDDAGRGFSGPSTRVGG